MSRYLTRAAKELEEREKSRRSEVYDNIGRETFEKIAREEDLSKKNKVKNPILDDPCQSWCSTQKDDENEKK